LSSIYYDAKKPSGFSSQVKLYKAAKLLNPKITKKDVAFWWSTQNIPSRFSKAKKKFRRSTFVSRKAHHTYLSDLADFSKLYKHNDGYKWLVIIQDLFSRKLIALIAQKNKTAKETAHSLERIFAVRTPKKLLTDKGGEFQGACKEVYKKYDILHYTTNDVTQKVAPVERAILVVKQRLFKVMSFEKTLKWTDKLDDILTVYNNSYNRTLKMTPEDAVKQRNQSEVFYNTVTRAELKNKSMGLDYTFPVGQIVRILKDQTFQKSYLGSYSNMLYKIVAREKKTGVPVYTLHELLTNEPITGSFYTAELKAVNIDESKLANVGAIHGIRLDNEQEEVLVSFKDNSKKRRWILYDSLIPYRI